MVVNSSNLPSSHIFKAEDYPDAPEYFSQFLSSLNLFVDPVYQLLNGGVNYQNLTVPKLYTKTITTPASGSVTFNFTNPLRITPSAVLVGNVYENGQPSIHPTDSVGVFWHFSQNVVYIDNLTNLDTSTTYVIVLVCL